jgi:threonine dehydrogenase-like Zn-dependent dehydrogenase
VYGTPPGDSSYLVLGHESLGEVVEVGAAVSQVKPGDLVVPSVRRPCPNPGCLPCRTDRQDFCATGDFSERGIKQRHGYMTSYYVESDRYLTPIPPGLREVGVLVEPLTVAEKALTQVLQVQRRLPWMVSDDPAQPGKGLRAVVLGAGPVGILGAMALLNRGFETFVYSRSPRPNPKAALVESIGAPYISSKETPPDELAAQVGRIDLVYEAVGVASVAFQVLELLAPNGIFVFTGIPAPKAPVSSELDRLMRDLVLKNQVALGTVNAELGDFQRAVDDLAQFQRRWPDQVKGLITGRYALDSFAEILLDDAKGIKNVITLD